MIISKMLVAIALTTLCATSVSYAANPCVTPSRQINPNCPGSISFRLVAQSSSSGVLPAVSQVGPSWGTTPATIAAAFPAVILFNVQHNASLNAVFTSLPDMELARFSTELASNDSGGLTPAILDTLAGQLNATQLVRLASAFGPTKVGSAVAVAPSAVQAAYASTTPASPLPLSAYFYSQRAVALPAAQPAYDLYLNFRMQSGIPDSATALRSVATLSASLKNPIVDFVATVGGLIAIAQFIDPNLRDDVIAAANWVNSVLMPEVTLEPSAFGTISSPTFTQIYIPGPLVEQGTPDDEASWSMEETIG